MSLFQRIKTPFSELAGDELGEPEDAAYTIGQLLYDRRVELELDLDTVGAELCIKPVYLAALEQGRSEDLPGPAYANGFIRAYAAYLGFDGEEVLEAYKADTANTAARPDLSLPVPLGERSVPGGPILMVALILAICGYGTWYYLSTGDRSRPERVAAVPADLRDSASVTMPARTGAAAAAPSAATGNGAGPTSSPPGSTLSSGLATPAGAPATASPDSDAHNPSSPAAPPSATASADTPESATGAPLPPATTGNAVAAGVDIRAVADCWIQVRAAADQSIVFSRVLKAGETYHVPRAGLVLRTGNAGALAIAVDGKPAPSIGGIGTLRRNVSLDPDALLAGTAVHG